MKKERYEAFENLKLFSTTAPLARIVAETPQELKLLFLDFLGRPKKPQKSYRKIAFRPRS